jgi:sugar lactone lactonase YvrE
MSVTSSISSGVLTRGLALGAVVGVVGLCTAAPALASTAYELSPFAGTGSAGPPTAGAATSSTLNSPYGVAVDASGNVYIADSGNDRVEKVTPSGQLSIIAGNGAGGAPTAGAATSSDLGSPAAVAVDAAGNVYIADSGNSVVEKVTPAGQLSIIAGDGSGGGTPTAGSATATTIGAPYGVAVDSVGNVYISDVSNERVYKVTPSGQLSFYAGNGTSGAPTPGTATSSDLGDPRKLAVDAAGDLFIADRSESVVEEVTPSGTLSVVAGSGTYGVPVPGAATSSPLDHPWGVAVDAAGDFYISDINGDIDEVTPAGTLSVIAGNDTTGAPTYGVPATTSDLEDPLGIASTPSGRLYFADTFHNTIDLLTPPAVANTTLPTISGTAAVGETLTASTGTWSNSPVTYVYQWEDCDSTGANCTPITGATGSTHVVTSADDGHRIKVIVTAQNGGGSASATSAQTGLVPAASTGTTPTVSVVSVPSQTVSAGVSLGATGGLTLPLACSAGGGCQVSVAFTIERSALTAGASGFELVALATGVDISASGTSDVSVKLSPAVLRGLQAGGVRSVQLAVVITNSAGTVTTGQLSMSIPAGLDVCPVSTGKITGTTLGPVTLGETKAVFEGRYPRHEAQRYGFDRFCFSAGTGFRVEYDTATVLNASKQASLRGRVVVAVTANHRYSIDGIHPGTKFASVSSRLHLGPGVQGGKNTWYVIPGRTANGVLKVRDGVVEGVGIAVKKLTDTATEQKILFDQAALTSS